jgi:uridine kinase
MLIIGIAGGSGKTTVVHQIMNELPDTEVGIISQDSYYKENHNLSFDERALLRSSSRYRFRVAGSPSKRA